MFYLCHIEEKLKAGEPLTYSAKLLEAGVIDVINENKSIVEPFSDIADKAFLQFRSDLTPNRDPFLQQENYNVNNELLQRENIEAEQSDDIQSSDTPHSFSGYATTSTQISTLLRDDHLSQNIRSFNLKQRQVFDFVYDWANSYIISKPLYGKQVSVSFHLFISGDGGYRKSHLFKTIFHSANKYSAKPVFMINETEISEGSLMLDFWCKFKLVELAKIILQKGNTMFIELLNKIRVGVVYISVNFKIMTYTTILRTVSISCFAYFCGK